MAPTLDHLDNAEQARIIDAFERAADRVGLAVFLVRVDASPPIVVYASDLLAAFVGRPIGELIGRPPWELVAPEQRDEVRRIIASRGPGAPPITLDFHIERPDGSRRSVEVGVARLATHSSELAVCYFRDTTDEQRMIDALRRSEARFRSLIEQAPDGVVIVEEGRIAMANPRAVAMFGVSDFEAVRGRFLSELLPPEDAARAAERIAQVVDGAELGPSEYRVLGRPERVLEVHSIRTEVEGRSALIAFVRDVTERKRLQQELVRQARLAAMGTMAATVGHEISNPLTYIQLSLERLHLALDSSIDPAQAARLREHVVNALHGVSRISGIVRDLRLQARHDPDETHGPVDVVAVVERALKVVEHDLRHRAQLVRQIPDHPVLAQAVAGRLEQVLINVLVNALQALDGTDPGHDRIGVTIARGPEVSITVSDTGAGIEEHERVFEPFYTTKPVGVGTGLGLAICKQLVESMQGRIELTSARGAGTSVTIVLPAATRPVAAATAQAARAPGPRLHVLVIDDEPKVREAMMGPLGADHDVEQAESAADALARIASKRYDVLVCDLMMPLMSGREFHEQLRRHHPGLERRVVFVTGGAFVPALAGFLESVDNLRLHKPFTSSELLEIVQAAHQRP